MAKQQEKMNKTKLLIIAGYCVGVMVVILGVIFWIMNSITPPFSNSVTGPYDPPETTGYYDPADFVLDENGFMTCLNGDYATGIDVSSHQTEVNWQQVKDAGVEFVFIRVGRRGSTEGQLYEDELSQAHYAGAREAGLKIGAYFYSQAISPKEAEEEAWFVLKKIADWELELPVVYDWEWGGEDSRTTDLSKEILTQCNRSFCQIIQNAGLQPMVYFNEHQGLEQMDLEALQEYPFWLAMYDSPMDFPYRVDYWQYTQEGALDGIDGNVDLNIFLPFAEEKEETQPEP